MLAAGRRGARLPGWLPASTGIAIAATATAAAITVIALRRFVLDRDRSA